MTEPIRKIPTGDFEDTTHSFIENVSVTGNQFGTIGGVFTPSILTILGVVMFMSAGVVIGRAGVIAALIILLLSKLITFLTSLSIAAISTNTPVKGGGAYYLISRSLGPESGGAIGLTLFLAQALSVPFYILGFTEALTIAFPHFSESFQMITYVTASALLLLNLFGAEWAIKIQYVILTTLLISVVIFLGGALTHFELNQFWDNMGTHFAVDGEDASSFWSAFAIYFPAVTGIMTGVNMSGDLKDPSRSIPRGTFAAVGVGALIYALEIVICAGAQSRDHLIGNFHQTLLDQALFGASWLVIAGVFAATLSSALGSLMGAPRILQALARDDVFPPLSPFTKGSGVHDEPKRGLWFTYILTIGVLWFASLERGADGSSGSALNSVGAILTMFFLYAYGMTNIAAFAESFSRNPSFRPRFKYFHWLTALLGALGCFFTALLINWTAALLAIAVIMALYLYVQHRVLGSTYGDVRRGFYYSRMRENLMKLAAQPNHAKNWRPNTLVLSGNPNTRHTLTQYALWLENRRGVATLVELLVGPLRDMIPKRDAALQRLQTFIAHQNLEAFCEVLVTENFDQGVSALLQCHAVGPLKPNLVMFGWPSSGGGSAERFCHLLQTVVDLKLSAVVTVDRGLPPLANKDKARRIDIWWRGHRNGSLMLILTYLLCHNLEWAHHKVRVLRALKVPEGASFEPLAGEAEAEIIDLLEGARIKGEAKIVEQTEDYPQVLRKHSRDAAVIFLGLTPPSTEDPEFYYGRYDELLARLPTTLLVYSAGHADLTS